MSHAKQIYLFVPPKTSQNPVIDYLSERYPPLPIDTMETFYNTRIAPYSRSGKSFCNNLEDMLKDLGDVEDWVTLISMNDEDVFAALLFNLDRVDNNGKKDQTIDIYIELFCGNQALPPTGEGTKLLNILEEASFKTKHFKIELSSVLRSAKYYTNHSYQLKKTPSKYKGLVDMQKNTRAVSNWRKAKAILSEKAVSYLSRKSAKIRSDMKSARTQRLGLGKKRRHTRNKRRGKTMKKKGKR